MIMSDRWIREQAVNNKMIDPFVESQKRKGVISYGLSSYGYDARVSDEWKIFSNINSAIVDPKDFSKDTFVYVKSDVCVIPPNSFALARTVETFDIPRDVLAICLGKSTYARAGIVVNMTPLEPCFSDDTEILTPSGWVLIKDISVGDSVMGVNAEGLAKFKRVKKKQKQKYVGDMLHFAGRSVDQMVTPNHKLYVGRPHGSFYSSGGRRTIWSTVEAKDVFGKHNFKFSRKVVWGGDAPATLTVGNTKYPAKAFLRFLGHWLGDGSAYVTMVDGKIHDSIVKLACFKERKVEAFKAAFSAAGINFSRTDTGYAVSNKNLCAFLLPLAGAANKRVPREFMQLHPALLECLLTGMMESDGNAGTSTIKTISKQLADDIQEIAFKTGRSAIVRCETIADINKYREKNAAIRAKHIYIVRLSATHVEPKIRPSTHKKQAYSGYVYDVTVSNHLIFVRRGGKASWSGNCWRGELVLEFSNTTPLPAKIYANEGACQILFFKGNEPCEVSYADRNGKYMNQTGVTTARL